jgi:hypothetical protein
MNSSQNAGFNSWYKNKVNEQESSMNDDNRNMDVVLVYASNDAITHIDFTSMHSVMSEQHGYEDSLRDGLDDVIYVIDPIQSANDAGSVVLDGSGKMSLQDCKVLFKFVWNDGLEQVDF